tara:strand:- start:1126 stop:1896 length:771 start_codon:yes stop_codon:yes gene_type:complete
MTENIKKEEVKPTVPQNDEAVIADLLKDVPIQDAIGVELPSRNKFYKLLNGAQQIFVRPMTFADEKALVSTKHANVDVLNVLLARCVSNVDVPSLLLMDKLFLIMKIREISYGNDYKVTINCPSCRRENKVSFDLSLLQTRFIEEDFEIPIPVKLPVLKKEITIRLPRVADEGYLQNAEISAANLWRFIESVDGHTKKTIVSGVLGKLPIKDMHTILKTINSDNYGIDPNVRFACTYCSHHEAMELPISADFFTGN